MVLSLVLADSSSCWLLYKLQNKILGLGEFERTRKNLISKINTPKVADKKILLTEYLENMVVL